MSSRRATASERADAVSISIIGSPGQWWRSPGECAVVIRPALRKQRIPKEQHSGDPGHYVHITSLPFTQRTLYVAHPPFGAQI
jgi:hypothetical protein